MNKELDDKVSSLTQKIGAHIITDDDVVRAVEDPLIPILSSWELWLLLGCLRHERRQKWVGHIVESRLNEQGSKMSRVGAFGHPDNIPQSGAVPDEPDWRYYFHGRGCCLTHKDGTKIDVDFADDGSALEIDPYFYTAFLTSEPVSQWCESRLRQPEALRNAWQFDLTKLGKQGLITGTWRFRLTEAGCSIAESLEPLTDLIENSGGIERCWILASLGDYSSAKKAAVNCKPGTISLLGTKAGEQLKKRADEVSAMISSSQNRNAMHALEALALLGPTLARHHLEAALLRDPASCVNHTALEILCAGEYAGLDDLLLRALRIFDRKTGFIQRFIGRTPISSTEEDRPRFGLVVKIVRNMFVRHIPATMPKRGVPLLKAVVQKNCMAMDDDAGFFLYLLDQKAGLAKLQSALSSRVPITRIGAAAFLAFIASRESIALLVRAAEGLPETGGHEAACALSLLSDEQAKMAASQWQRRNDGYEEIEGKPINFEGREVMTWRVDDMMRSSTRSSVKYALDGQIKKYSSVLRSWLRGKSGR